MHVSTAQTLEQTYRQKRKIQPRTEQNKSTYASYYWTSQREKKKKSHASYLTPTET